MNVLIRDIPDTIMQRMDAEAQRRNVSRQDLLSDLLTATYGDPPLVVGWVKFDRPGELDADAPCPECGQPLTEVWGGLLSNGEWVAPRCQWCATTEP